MPSPATQQKTPAKPAPFNPNRSPKERFLTVPQWISQHRQMVDSDVFTRACDLALLQYQQTVTANITNGEGAGAAGLKMRGAIEFLNTLRNLSEVPTVPTRRPDDNLAH